MTASHSAVAEPLRVVAQTAALFHEECVALDQLVDELYGEVERLRDELLARGEELAELRRQLAKRERQLSGEHNDTAGLREAIEQQQSQLKTALSEIKALR